MLKKLFTLAVAFALLAPNAIGQEKEDAAERLIEKDVEVKKALSDLEAVSSTLKSVLIELRKTDGTPETRAQAEAVKKSIAEIEVEIAKVRKMGELTTKLRFIEAAELLESAEIVELVETMEEKPEAPRGFLGVNLADHEGPGVRVTSTIAGSPARKAKFREGDLILAIGKNEVENVEGLAGLISKHKPGSIVHLRIQRGEECFNYALNLGNRDKILAAAEREGEGARRREEEMKAKDGERRGRGGLIGPREMKELEAIERQMVEFRQMHEKAMKKFHEMGAEQEKYVEGAHKALKKGQYGQAAEYSMAAQKMLKQREEAERHIHGIRERLHDAEVRMEKARIEMRKREAANRGERKRDVERERAAAERRERAAAERREREREGAKKPRGGVEDRVANLEKRLQRIERLLEKLVADR